jgi:threonine dehydrogenase-like Zn-dependent dehydrogenase
VLGAGTIGLLALQVAHASGAGRVLIIAKRPHQAEAAQALGADAIIPADADVPGQVKRYALAHAFVGMLHRGLSNAEQQADLAATLFNSFSS